MKLIEYPIDDTSAVVTISAKDVIEAWLCENLANVFKYLLEKSHVMFDGRGGVPSLSINHEVEEDGCIDLVTHRINLVELLSDEIARAEEYQNEPLRIALDDARIALVAAAKALEAANN